MSTSALAQWHAMVEARDPAGLDDLLAEDAVFHSPVVHAPQAGRRMTSLYLRAAFQVLMPGDFRYVREIVGENDALLEFECELDGVSVNGIDLIRWNSAGRITDFKVMIRPLKAIHAVRERMAAALQAKG
jgi:hypothetical protein